MGTVWTQNSFVYDPTSFTESYCFVAYATIAVAGCCLIHSYSLHGGRFNSVRIITDTACLSTVIAGLLFLPVKAAGDAIKECQVVLATCSGAGDKSASSFPLQSIHNSLLIDIIKTSPRDE